jgi:hypothetical protein
MKSNNSTESRLSALERSNSRWRLGAVGMGTLLAGILIGGMGERDSAVQDLEHDPKEVVGVAGTDEQIFRVHRDGSVTYLKIENANRTANGLWDWGNVLIDHNYKNKDKR